MKDSRVCSYHFGDHLFFNELSSASITSFHLFQSKHFIHSVMVLGSRLFRKLSTMMIEKHVLTIVVLRSYVSPELV
jgi:hypothetical protein